MLAVQVDKLGKYIRFCNVDEDPPRVVENEEGYIVSVAFPVGFKKYVTEDKAFKFDIETYFTMEKDEDGEEHDYSSLWSEGLTSEEISEITKPPEPTELDRIGEQLVQRELESLELRSQNEVLGGQIVERELEATDLKAQNEALGGQIVGLELRVLTLEIKPEGDGENV